MEEEKIADFFLFHFISFVYTGMRSGQPCMARRARSKKFFASSHAILPMKIGHSLVFRLKEKDWRSHSAPIQSTRKAS